MQRIVSANRAILIDDDDGVRRSLQLLLHGSGYDVRSYASAASLLDSAQIDDAEILVADYRLVDGDGIDVLRRLRLRGWSGRSILISAYLTPAIRQEAATCGFDAVLEKPLRQRALLTALAG